MGTAASAACKHTAVVGALSALCLVPPAHRLQGWEPSYALANKYADGGAGIGPHSDRLTKLGPCPIIARCLS